MGIKNNELRLGQNDTPLEDPREGEVSLRIDSTGAIFTKAEGAVSETGVVTSASAPLKYSANNSLYGKNNTLDGLETSETAIQIGVNCKSYGENGITIGEEAKGYNSHFPPYSSAYSPVAIGRRAVARNNSVSVGGGTKSGGDACAIGPGSRVGDGTTNVTGVALGRACYIPKAYPAGIAIGKNATTTASNQMVFQVGTGKNLRFSQWAPVAETPAATHTLEVMISDVLYKILLAAV